jgi:hypothetical protein
VQMTHPIEYSSGTGRGDRQDDGLGSADNPDQPQSGLSLLTERCTNR